MTNNILQANMIEIDLQYYDYSPNLLEEIISKLSFPDLIGRSGAGLGGINKQNWNTNHKAG